MLKVKSNTMEKTNKDYLGMVFWRNLRGGKLYNIINPMVEEVIKIYEEKNIKYNRDDIEYQMWKKMKNNSWELFEYTT